MEQWGIRIYGCDTCQAVCPLNQGAPQQGIDTDYGVIGAYLPLQEILTATPEQLTLRFKKSVLGMSWIDPLALQRNALIAAGNFDSAGNSIFSLLPLLHKYSTHPDPVLSRTAQWALGRLHAL
jgi:epoxyqueuosine reductase